MQFDTEALQTRLIKCCLMAGVKDFWIAEDLTNAVESALAYQAEKGILFTPKEIDQLISKMLDESGNNDIGAAFRTTVAQTFRDINVIEDYNIRKVVEQGLGLSDEELYRVSGKVHNACREIQINNAPESLLLELAKFYRSQTKELPRIAGITVKSNGNSKWIASKAEILEKLSPKTQELIKSGMIDFAGIGSFFPSVKLEIRFASLARYYNLEGIITELQLFPCFPIAVDALNEVISVIRENIPELNSELKAREMPIYLKFSDIYFFAEKYFGIKISAGEKFCREIAGTFAESLKYGVQVKIVKI
jgi:hypothetical protein